MSDDGTHGTAWTIEDARDWIEVPGADDDKYARGVLGVVTGSDEFPGAAVLGVEAAMRTGVGMVRYIGDARPSDLVLQRRPEVVTASGRVQAWLMGSGMDASHRDATNERRLREGLAQAVPIVIDAGALDLVPYAQGPVVVTPHHRELARLLQLNGTAVDLDEIRAEPALWAGRAASATGATVLLKGSTSYAVAPGGRPLRVSGAPAWLATAGSGDVLAGVLGALVATHSERVDADGNEALAALAASAAVLHAEAARIASEGGPIVALDVARSMPRAVVRALG
jgi:hydroxyethylthiazole kinase-like uncharacterized protein yjeF